MELPYDIDGVSLDSDRKDGDFDGAGNTLAGELIPDTMMYRAIPFVFGPKEPGALNVVSCKGQSLPLPEGKFSRLYLLVAAVGGPAEGGFSVVGPKQAVTARQWVQDYADPPGQWNNRLVGGGFTEEIDQIDPAYINRAPIAWYGSHRHTISGGNESYKFTYAYSLRLNIAGATGITLPDNPKIRLLAATAVAPNGDDVRAARSLYDVTDNSLAKIQASRITFLDSTVVSLSTPICGAKIHYTADGSTPSPQSSAYVMPLTLKQTTTLKAAAFLDGAENHISSVTFRKLIPREPDRVDSAAAGLGCRYYEGSWSKLPDFDSLKIVKEAVVDTIAIPPFAQKEDYGLVFTGYIRVPRDGLYTFYINSDDGSALKVGDSLYIDNDGIHGGQELSAEIAIKTGLHPIVVRMFQAKGGQALDVFVEGPDLKKQAIPRDMMFHAVTKMARSQAKNRH